MFLEFILVDWAEISHMNTEFVPVTEPAQLPDSYEEALSGPSELVNNKNRTQTMQSHLHVCSNPDLWNIGDVIQNSHN